MTRLSSSASISARVSSLLLLAVFSISAAPAQAANAPVVSPTTNVAPAMPTAAAQGMATAQPNRLAVIDVQRILQESLAARHVQKQLEEQRAKFQAEISGRETKLHEADNALKEQRNTGKSEDYGAREQELRQKFIEMERDVQAKRHALDEGFTSSMGVVRSNLLAVVEALARRRGVQAVLLKQQALWFDSALDITDEVLTNLNAQLAEVPVKIDLKLVPEVAPTTLDVPIKAEKN